MNISRTSLQTQKTPLSAKPLTKPEPQPQETYFDAFTKSASSEVPKAMTYSALAGVAVGGAAIFMGANPLTSIAEGLGAAAAVGAGVGLVGGLLLSAVTARPAEAPPAPPAPPEPKEPPAPPEPPKPSPEEQFATDLKSTEQILDRRLAGLKSLMQAEQTRHDSRGRSGLKAMDQAKKLMSIAKKDLQAQERPPLTKLEDEIATTKARLAEVRAEQQQVLDVQLNAAKLVKDSIGRSGRQTERAAEEVTKEFQREAARLTKALQQ